MSDITKSLETLIVSPPEENWVLLEKTGGVRVNTLYENPETGASISLLDIPKGAGIPVRHKHASNQFMYCVKGTYEYLEPDSLILQGNSFYWNPKGSYHGPTRAIEDCLMLEIYDGPHYDEIPSYHTEDTVGKLSSES
ncbi:cupin domain-containing protein [Aliamphritea hakodatensis]|uniref:cupin domain-containing protein n=1 Tax=Aliamphritea hakodatensis TaxID=2895352 RepID=UPI0022FD7F99|nr:hypothetical protein [Aliamphritea hakodatensis]